MAFWCYPSPSPSLQLLLLQLIIDLSDKQEKIMQKNAIKEGLTILWAFNPPPASWLNQWTLFGYCVLSVDFLHHLYSNETLINNVWVEEVRAEAEQWEVC